MSFLFRGGFKQLVPHLKPQVYNVIMLCQVAYAVKAVLYFKRKHREEQEVRKTDYFIETFGHKYTI